MKYLLEKKYVPNVRWNTWQDLLTNCDANLSSDQYDVLVDINENVNLLVRMQFLNIVSPYFL